MDNEWMRQVEIALDSLRSQVSSLTAALVSLSPQVSVQPDPSRPPGVVVDAPAPVVS